MARSHSTADNLPPESPELSGFRGPHVAVDIALLTVVPENTTRDFRIGFLLHKRQDGLARGQWALPGRMVRERERLNEAVEVALNEKCGISGINPVQLYVFDEPTRDARGWVMSVGYLAVERNELVAKVISENQNLNLGYISPGVTFRIELPNNQDDLPFEQIAIVERAVRVLRREYEKKPDPYRFLGRTFTLYQLRKLHEAIAKGELDKDAFRRKMEPQLIATDSFSSGSVGKPAQLFKRRSRSSQ
ncbi:MAG: NUDIX hydrolase [Actinomycetota bacterium]